MSAGARKLRPPFPALHAATLDADTTADELARLLREAEAMPDRRRLSEGAVYTSACRRYLLLTGEQWREQGVTAETTTWSDSAHSYRLRPYPSASNPLSLQAQCSCGARELVADEAAGEAWHTAHLQAVAQ